MDDINLVALLALSIGCGLFGGLVGTGKAMGGASGFLLGLLLGPCGLVFVLFASAAPEPSPLDEIARPDVEGWHPDPLGRFDARFFDGERWTQHVGRVGSDGSRSMFEDPV